MTGCTDSTSLAYQLGDAGRTQSGEEDSEDEGEAGPKQDGAPEGVRIEGFRKEGDGEGCFTGAAVQKEDGVGTMSAEKEEDEEEEDDRIERDIFVAFLLSFAEAREDLLKPAPDAKRATAVSAERSLRSEGKQCLQTGGLLAS